MIKVTGNCMFDDCGCVQYDQMDADKLEKQPPFHDGCSCVVVDKRFIRKQLMLADVVRHGMTGV